MPTRVGIVGVGHVGASFAYALLLSGLAAEIVLIDADRRRAEGEALDLSHATPFAHPTRVWAGDYPDLAGATVTVIAAGANQAPGETRLDLLTRNAAIFRQIVPEIVRHNPDGILLIATNPVDLLTHESWRLTDLPPGRVIGSGTVLDTARFRQLLSGHFGVDPRSVHAIIIGEHGDSEVPVWSLANIAGARLPDFCAANGLPYDRAALDALFVRTRDAAYEIISRKGATYYAVAAGLLRIVEAIVRDQRTVLTVSSLIAGETARYYAVPEICLSVPAILDRGGVRAVLRLDLDATERDGLRRSAEALRAGYAGLGLAPPAP